MSDDYPSFYTDIYGARTEHTFTPPSVIAGYQTGDWVMDLWTRGARGVSVLRTGTTFTEKRNVTERQIQAADSYYLGGRYYPDISETEAEFLDEAGYDVTVTEVYP